MIKTWRERVITQDGLMTRLCTREEAMQSEIDDLRIALAGAQDLIRTMLDKGAHYLPAQQSAVNAAIDAIAAKEAKND